MQIFILFGSDPFRCCSDLFGFFIVVSVNEVHVHSADRRNLDFLLGSNFGGAFLLFFLFRDGRRTRRRAAFGRLGFLLRFGSVGSKEGGD